MRDKNNNSENYSPRITTNHASSGRSPISLLIIVILLFAALGFYSYFFSWSSNENWI